MAGIPSDYTIIGTVLAVSVAIILISGLALYVSFRVKETLREEKGKGARIAKVGLLIGLLFLSGGVFYFFASGFNANAGSVSTTSVTTQSGALTSTSLATSTSQTASTQSTTSAGSITSTSSASAQGVNMNLQCPTSGGSVSAGGTFSCTVTIYNLGSSAYQSATLVSSADFAQFSFQSCSKTVNGNPASCTVASATEISLGDVQPGTTILSLGVGAPSNSGQKSCTITLAFPGIVQPITKNFTIQVTNKP